MVLGVTGGPLSLTNRPYRYTMCSTGPAGRSKPKVNYEEGSTTESNLFSSMKWALTEVDNTPTYLGKWGHRMLAWEASNTQGEKEPALYLIAGDAVEGGSFVSDVFVSTETRERHASLSRDCVFIHACSLLLPRL